jgi:hypothetical protein
MLAVWSLSSLPILRTSAGANRWVATGSRRFLEINLVAISNLREYVGVADRSGARDYESMQAIAQAGS